MPTASTHPSRDSAAHPAVNYRPFVSEDIGAAHRLSSAINWPHRIDDWRFVASVGGGFVAEHEGRVVGTALRWKYGSDTASLGMVIVAPEYQGFGIGRALMTRVLDDLGTRMTQLIATRDGRPLYEKLGFVARDTVGQHQGAAFQPPLLALAAGERLRPIGVSDEPKLIDLATRACGLDRGEVLPALLEVADGIALDHNDEVTGFALFRRFGRGYAIGPVVAPDVHRAKALISHWLAQYAGMFVRVDSLIGGELSDWLVQMGLVRVDTGTVMTRNGTPRPDVEMHQFALINQALC